MINNLIDDRFTGGLEYRFGLRSIDITAGQWQTAVDGSRIDSYSVGFLTPIGDRYDLEFRLSLDESDSYGRTTAFSFFLYYFLQRSHNTEKNDLFCVIEVSFYYDVIC